MLDKIIIIDYTEGSGGEYFSNFINVVDVFFLLFEASIVTHFIGGFGKSLWSFLFD